MNLLLRWLRKLKVRLLWLTAAVLGALLIHIGTVLVIARYGPNPAFSAIAKIAAVNRMTVLDPVVAGRQPLPFLSPAERYAACHFDLRNGPVAVKVTLGGDDWVIGVYSPGGTNVYAISGADLQRREVELLLASNADNAGAPLPIARGESLTTSVGLADRTGIVMISAPATRLAYDAETARLLAGATCTQRARAEAG